MYKSLAGLIGLAIGVALPGPVWAQAQLPAGGSLSAAPVYVPPSRGAPEARTGGATRGRSGGGAKIDVIAPNEVGETVQDQPTLYWFNSVPIKYDVEITLVVDETSKTVLDVTVPGPVAAGIHGFPLAGTKTRLDPQTVYQWSVTAKISKTEPSQDIVASGMVERVADSKLAGPVPAGGVAAVDAYARSGIWYDAIDTISRQIAEKPGDGTLRSYRVALMTQVGLNEVAAFETKSGN